MKVKRNLTRYKCSRSMCRNNRQVKNYKRKLLKITTYFKGKLLKIWINNEFD